MLKDERERFARLCRWEVYHVAPDPVLEELARERPRSISISLEVKGMGQKSSDKFGKTFLDIVIVHERREAAAS